MLGNDLSYELDDNRRLNYYADGDYSSNIATGRDEAKYNLAWMGFEYEFNPIIEEYVINMKPRGTSWQLWSSKKWLEMHTMMAGDSTKLHLYNCSGSGILGMPPKDENKDKLLDRNNWKLMDSVCPKRWHTRRFIEAITEFLEAKEKMEWRKETLIDVRSTTRWPLQMDTVNGTGSWSGRSRFWTWGKREIRVRKASVSAFHPSRWRGFIHSCRRASW